VAFRNKPSRPQSGAQGCAQAELKFFSCLCPIEAATSQTCSSTGGANRVLNSLNSKALSLFSIAEFPAQYSTRKPRKCANYWQTLIMRLAWIGSSDVEVPCIFSDNREFRPRRRVRIPLRPPPRIPTSEGIFRPSGNYRPIGRLVGVSFVSAGVFVNFRDVLSPLSPRTKFGFPEIRDSGSKRHGSNVGQLLPEGRA
jgi:hypothetical protein